jgi:hypothetical protein
MLSTLVSHGLPLEIPPPILFAQNFISVIKLNVFNLSDYLISILSELMEAIFDIVISLSLNVILDCGEEQFLEIRGCNDVAFDEFDEPFHFTF